MGGGSSLCAEFPQTWEEFIKKYAATPFEDGQEWIPAYRAMQMMCYYIEKDYVQLGREYSTKDYNIVFAEDPLYDLRNGSPRFMITKRLN